MRHEQAGTVRNERRNSLPVMITPQNRVEKSTAETTATGNPPVAHAQYFKGSCQEKEISCITNF